MRNLHYKDTLAITYTITIGHFRVLLCFCFKTSLSARPFIWKWVPACNLIFMQIEVIFTLNSFALRLPLKQRHKGTRKWPVDGPSSVSARSLRFWIKLRWLAVSRNTFKCDFSFHRRDVDWTMTFRSSSRFNLHRLPAPVWVADQLKASRKLRVYSEC